MRNSLKLPHHSPFGELLLEYLGWLLFNAVWERGAAPKHLVSSHSKRSVCKIVLGSRGLRWTHFSFSSLTRGFIKSKIVLKKFPFKNQNVLTKISIHII
jgi:hypothetical protein